MKTLGFDSVASVRRSSTSGDAAVSRNVQRLGRQPVKRGPLDPPSHRIRSNAVETDREVGTIDTPPPRSWLVAIVVTLVQVDVLGSAAGRTRWHGASLPAGVVAFGSGADGQHNGFVKGVNSARPSAKRDASIDGDGPNASPAAAFLQAKGRRGLSETVPWRACRRRPSVGPGSRVQLACSLTNRSAEPLSGGGTRSGRPASSTRRPPAAEPRRPARTRRTTGGSSARRSRIGARRGRPDCPRSRP
jgi:hypothetical protein